MTRAREIANVLGRNIESTTFTATAGQTAFSITHAAGRIQVYMNGLLLDPTVDWTSDGSTVTLTSGAVAGDELEVVKYDNLAVADAIPRTGHTGTIDFSSATFTPPAGHVVQVVQADESQFGTRFTTTSTSYVSTGYDLVITPTSTSSKILITCNFAMASSSGYAYGLIARNGTQLANTQFALGGGGYPWGMGGAAFLDEPNSTSAVTYTLYGFTSSGTAYYGWNSSSSNNNMNYFIAQEIAG